MSKNSFDFNNVESIKGRVQPGVEELEITGVIGDTNDNDKYYLEVSTISLDRQNEHNERFYFSTEKGSQISKQRLKSLLITILGNEKANGNFSEEQLNAALTGKKFRGLLTGEEYEYNGETRMRTQFAFNNFSESLDVSKEKSKLKFDPVRHVKRLPVAPSMRNTNTEGDGKSTENLF